MAGNIVPRADGQANLGRADKEFDTIYAKNLGGTLSDKIAMKDSPAFTGTPTAPTAAEGTQTTQLATTEFVQAANASKADKTELAKYLPLSGGTMTGEIHESKITGNVAHLNMNADDGYLRFCGGTKSNNGAGVILWGKNHPTYPGSFMIDAMNDGESLKRLQGNADGALTWNGNPIATTNKLSMPTMNYVNVAVPALTQNGWTYGFYIAPSDGWMNMRVYNSGVNDNIILSAPLILDRKQVNVGESASFTVPLSKGDGVSVYSMTAAVTIQEILFITAASAT